MFQAVPLSRVDLLSEEIRRTQCARFGLMSLDESAYIMDPVMRPMALLEAKSIIRFGISIGHYPRYYSKLLESNDIISLRLSTKPEGEIAKRKLDESFGMDLALGVGQMIPGVKTFAGIAGVAYYAKQAYDSFQSGSTLGGAGNLFLTLLSAAAIEPLGAAAWTGPIVTALGPLTKLGRSFENFMSLIVKGAFAPIGKLLMKVPGLKSFVGWIKGGGMAALEGAGGWLSKNASRLAGWLERKGVEWASKSGAEGVIGKVAQFLAQKTGNAAQLISKFITNMKTFISTSGAKWSADAGTAAASEAGEAAAKASAGAARAAATEASTAVKAAEDAYRALVGAQFKSRPDLAAKYVGNEAMLLNDIANGRVVIGNQFELRKAAEALQSSKAILSSAEAAVAKEAGGATASATSATETGAVAGAKEPLTQTAGAIKNLGSAISYDLRTFHSFLDRKAGELLTKSEAAQIKTATEAMKGNPVIFKFGDGRTAKVVFADKKTGQVFKKLLDPKTGQLGRPVKSTIEELMATNAGRNQLAAVGLDPRRWVQISRGITRGFSSGSDEIPAADAGL